MFPLFCLSSSATGSETGYMSVIGLLVFADMERNGCDLQVVGITKKIQTIDRAEGSSFKPTTSAPTGAMVVQNVPATVPTIMAKNIKTPKLLAKIQIMKQKRPPMKVQSPARLMRPALSEKMPTRGRPRPWPRLSNAPTIEPCCELNPMLTA